MDNLLEEIINKAISDEIDKIEVPSFDEVLINMRCFEALKKIKGVLADDSLDDPECFRRIEEIVRIFEELGSDGGGRHDF